VYSASSHKWRSFFWLLSEALKNTEFSFNPLFCQILKICSHFGGVIGDAAPWSNLVLLTFQTFIHLSKAFYELFFPFFSSFCRFIP
ncbi:MAG: hypothetical protein Q9P14_15065, partial [candidate division KSB1 bacterium]|nr:hypothetical protein [candidate division KSB1 bacterium]